MAFINNDIFTTTFTGTTVTGSTIFSGSNELSTVRISQNRKIFANQRTLTALTANSGAIAETIVQTFSFPANSLSIGNTLEFMCLWSTTASTTSTRTVRFRFGTAGTTSDTNINQSVFSPATSVETVSHMYGRLCLNTNTNFDTYAFGTNTNVFGILSQYASAATLNLSTVTTYLTISVQRSVLTSDTVSIRSTDVFINT